MKRKGRGFKASGGGGGGEDDPTSGMDVDKHSTYDRLEEKEQTAGQAARCEYV